MNIAADVSWAAHDQERARRFREKAEECRAMAERMSDRLARETFLEVGASYQSLAERLEQKVRQVDRAAGE